MANIDLPGTSSFVGEFLILVGSFKVNTSITFFGATGMILGGCYSLWLFNRIAYENLEVQYCNNFLDLNRKEFLIFLPLIIRTLALGNIVLTSMHMSVNTLIEFIYF
jgi:NADH:ubiquinone oxidoreductase subunit 4 (subunit M)